MGEISVLSARNPDVATMLQLFAMKKSQDTQKSTALALVSQMSSPPVQLEPTLPYLGQYVDLYA
jgi:hypothetical protein